MTKDEALKLALEWFEKDGEPDHHPVVIAIREALTESEARRKEFSETTKRNMEHVEWYLSTHAPEPVAWRYLTRYPTQNVWTYCGSEPKTKPEREPLYTIPPQRKPLTDEEIDDLWNEAVKYAPSEVRIKDFARSIEAKLKVKAREA